MRPVRVLSVCPSFNTCGGIERYCVNYLMRFDDRIQMDFITHDLSDDALKNEVAKRSSKVYVLPPFSAKKLPLTLKRLRSFFHKAAGRYDILHCNMANAACFYFPPAKTSGIRTRILHSHQDRAADTPSHALRNIPLLAAGVPMATDRVACSRQAGDFLFKNRSYTVIKNAIDAAAFRFDPEARAAFRKKYHLGDSFVIGTIGRLTEQKNQSRLLDILRIIIATKNSDVKLLIVGEGHLRDELLKKTAALSLDKHVVFAGSIPDVAPALSAMDVFVLPSHYEGLGIVNIEAQASGLSVVVSEGVPDDAKMNDAFFKLPLSAKDSVWAEQLLHRTPLFTEAQRSDPRHIEKIIENGYDLSTEAKKLEDFYLEKAMR